MPPGISPVFMAWYMFAGHIRMKYTIRMLPVNLQVLSNKNNTPNKSSKAPVIYTIESANGIAGGIIFIKFSGMMKWLNPMKKSIALMAIRPIFW